MTRLLFSCVLVLYFSSAAVAQPLPTKPTPAAPNVPGKFKAVAPLTVKAGNHIVIDATSAKGNVEFEFDPVAFPKDRATYSEKKKLLVLSTDTNGTYRITVYSWDDKAKERIEVKVTGGDGPDPIPDPTPIPTDPLEALKLEMRAGFAKMDARLRLLEQIKPIPPPDPKPDPKPLPDDPIAKAIFGAWQQEFAADKKDSAEKLAQCYDAAVKVAATATVWGEVSSTIKGKAKELGVAGKLPIVATTINTQLLASGFPASPSVLMQPGDAAKATATLTKVSATLRLLP